MEVLVLNKNYQAIAFTTFKRAVAKLYTQRVEVIDFSNNTFNNYDFSSWLEYSATSNKECLWLSDEDKIVLPPAIRSLHCDKSITRKLRVVSKNIFIRDDYLCAYCGKRFSTNNLSIDHIIPKSKKGPHTWDNLITACIPCNSKKGDRTLKEAGMSLLYQPYTPQFRLFSKEVVSRLDEDTKNTWSKFIDLFDILEKTEKIKEEAIAV